MSQVVKFSNPQISKEIKRLTGEKVTANLIGMVRREAASSERVSGLIARAIASLSKLKQSKPRPKPKGLTQQEGK